jgi:hypothetical protein
MSASSAHNLEAAMNNPSDITLKAEVAEVKTQLADALSRLARAEGAIEQLNRSIAAGNRMTNWQFIGFVLVMSGTLFGTLYWSTGVLERRFDERFTQMEKLFNERFAQSEKRSDERSAQMEKRFEDLRQVVLSKR